MNSRTWDNLLAQARNAHGAIPALSDFCAFPEGLSIQELTPHHTPPADLMVKDPGLFSDSLSAFRDAFIAGSDMAHWRETYKNTKIGSNFTDRFGCYELIGSPEAPFVCKTMRSFVVYAPPGLHYPWHHHPAEELYLVLAGEAEFALEGAPAKTLRAGDTLFHPSNRPHAMTTHAHPVMAYVLWRGDLGTPPVWTYPEEIG